MLHAVTREVSRAIVRCELTHLARRPIDLERARAQHRAYERVLERLGARVERLEEAPELPDSVFVEDTALVLDEIALLLRPGAPSRRGETGGVARALERHRAHRPLARLEGPGTVDGGDVLRLGRTLWVGRSSRTDAAGVAALAAAVAPHGYRVEEVAVGGCLHLKSAATAIADDMLLVQPAWIDVSRFGGLRTVEVDAREPYGANALRVGDRLLYAAAFPATADRLRRLGFALEPVELDELAKAEGAVTCCSLVFEAPALDPRA